MKRKRNYDNMVWGVFLIVAAFYLLGSGLGWIGGASDFGFWDLLLTFFFGLMLVKGIIKRSFGKIFFSLAFLGIIYDEPLGIEAITPWTVLFAALLLTIATNLLFPKKHKKKYSDKVDACFSSDSENCSGERLDFNVTFGEASKYISSDNFIHADCKCCFGELNVYLDNAMIQGPCADISVDLKFGEMTLYVPKQWRVNCNVSKAFGEIQEQGQCSAQEDAKVLNMDGNVNFGELNIIYI